jgi:ABC-2 type transport system permease protein
MNWSLIWAIARKDLKEVAQNKAAVVPAVVVPAVFIIVFPLAIILIPQFLGQAAGASLQQLELTSFVQRMPTAMMQALAGLSPLQSWVVLAIGFFFAPMFLILPLMMSSIVASDSFVGEKERKTLEGLLYSPTSDAELVLGKIAASVLPALGLCWASFAVYSLVVNLAGFPLMGRVWFPTALWWPLMLWVVPAVAVLGMASAVIISSRVSTFMEAYQMSAAGVVLVLALVAGQVTGVLFLSVPVALLVGLGVWVLDAGLLWLGVRTFSRNRLFSRL